MKKKYKKLYKNLILKGDAAKMILNYILLKYDTKEKCKELALTGYFFEDGKFTCFDNTSNNCWVEQAETKKDAKKWCMGLIEAEDLYCS